MRLNKRLSRIFSENLGTPICGYCLQTGLFVLPGGLTITVISVVVGRVYDRLGCRDRGAGWPGLRCDLSGTGKEKLAAIIKEHRAKGTLERRIYQVMRGSYASDYRRILPKLLSVLEFRSNNGVHRPVLGALGWIRRAVETGCRVVPRDGVPIEGVIPPKWRGAIIGKDGRINRISYELCVLSQLRDRIRAKEIWVVGADRYRNPDDDLPKDFESRRAAYYHALNLTSDARAFTRKIQAELERELRLLMPNSPATIRYASSGAARTASRLRRSSRCRNRKVYDRSRPDRPALADDGTA
ncbi:hypothetical protein [Mesorhizobium sp. M7A.F.Ca.US.011.01.1.1]|uniref:hypothetical protein n=1 Tax=Mesorhizobium sp. M7A.F.Ca.US.011.01.1.1 TaxID=2496741 RepID=UPI001FE1E6E3|nr:hypothetical protein [Mesorhizobium sp. M7A.F.Ca.US.011.01.1.1]